MKDSEKLRVAQEALQWSYEMFLHRDIMNAQVHCAPLRLSAITNRTKQALDLLRHSDDKGLKNDLPHHD